MLCLLTPDPGLTIVGRAIVGIGSGAGFVAGARLCTVRPRALAALQGLYGGATMAGGGLAIAIVPQLEDSLGWRAPYWSALAIAVAVGALLAVSPRDARERKGSRSRPRRPAPAAASRSCRLATFGLAVVLANWVVTPP